jgi:hypothetical protein
MQAYKRLSVGLLVLAIILMACGGLIDMCGRDGDRLLGASKQHLWADGTFALVLSGWVLLWGITAGK